MTITTEKGDFATALELQPPDVMLSLIALARADTRPDKIDLGVGMYRDASGGTPIFRAIKEAESRLLDMQQTKAYLGTEGDPAFLDLLVQVPLGASLARDPRLCGIQTPGGTGALWLAANLFARARPGATVWMPDPTWPNHSQIFEAAGLQVRRHPYFSVAEQRLVFADMIGALEGAADGDALLLHGCCHNPTGADLDREQWLELVDLIERKKLIAIIDLAYQGLGRGLEEDAEATRLLLERAGTVMLAYSCDKNFGLYRERTGALWVRTRTESAVDRVRSNLLKLARVAWSMPPDHGAAAVRMVLEDAKLTAAWMTELAEMQRRVAGIRSALAAGHPLLAPIGTQAGMFSQLPLSPAAIETLRERHGIYMVGNGRINLAGLAEKDVDRLAAALIPVLAASSN